MGMAVSEVSGVPWSFTAHRWDIVENNLLTRKARHASFARFISRSGLRLARERGFDAVERSLVLHMGAVLPSSLSRTPAEREVIRLLCPANLLPVKGHEYLIQALGLLRDDPVELWLAGHGEREAELRELVKRLNLTDRVRFLGQLPHDELMGFYEGGHVDLVVLPSVDLGSGLHEGIPVSLMEAMAYGIPVVSTRTGGIPELLDEGAGMLVAPANVTALAEALSRLIRNQAERNELGQAGRKAVMEHFDIERVVDRLEALWQQNEPSRLSRSVSGNGTPKV